MKWRPNFHSIQFIIIIVVAISNEPNEINFYISIIKKFIGQ